MLNHRHTTKIAMCGYSNMQVYICIKIIPRRKIIKISKPTVRLKLIPATTSLLILCTYYE